MMSHVRILEHVNQKYRYITEATIDIRVLLSIISLCKRAKVKNITEFYKAVQRTIISLVPRSLTSGPARSPLAFHR